MRASRDGRHQSRGRATGIIAPALAALALVAAPRSTAAGDAADKTHPLQATLEILRPFTYEGVELMVRVAVFNTSTQPFDNSGGIDLLGGLNVSNDTGARFSPKTKTASDPKKQPAVIPAGGFFGVIQDITPLIPEISKAGTYSITWEAAGVRSGTVTARVIPRFDPQASYVAVVETDFGYIEFDLMTAQAPKHVQNFYDLASQGFYDKTILHRVVKGVEVRGGDPTGSGSGLPIYTLEPEITRDLKHKRGTLSAVNISSQKHDNGSQFVITLAPTEEYDGNLSIFGQMRKGDEVLQAIESIPTTGQYDVPYFRPLKPIVLRSVVVKKAEAPKAG